MKRHFFIDKSNTIIKDSYVNTGLNPVMTVGYGSSISRGVILVNLNKIKSWIEKENLDTENLVFVLHMTNYFSVDGLPYEKELMAAQEYPAERACSFDIDFFDVDKYFDAGRGYNYSSDLWVTDKTSVNKHGCNWFNSKDNEKWETPGIYSSGSTIIATQHFDFGDENINLNITDYLKNKLANYSGETNDDLFCSIGLKAGDQFEDMSCNTFYCVNFFTDNTNLFFHPYIEVISEDYVFDDRYSFNPNKENNLYLYVNDGDNRYNLDMLPECSVGRVSQVRKGVYKTTILPGEIDANTKHIEYDVWSHIVINGITYEDVEQEFYVERPSIFNIKDISYKELPLPSVYGIKDSENVNRGDLRTVFVEMREMYSTDKKMLITSAEYRIYIKVGQREHTVFDYDHLEYSKGNMFFELHTEDLIPGKYFVDIKIKLGGQERIFKDVIHFNITNELKEKYIE